MSVSEAALPLSRPPSWATVLHRQLALLVRSTRVAQIALAALVLLLLAELASRGMANQNTSRPPLELLFGWYWLIGFAWGLMIWGDEGPARRSYHASLPVDRARHDLLRVAAGALWLIALTALVLAIGMLLPALRGSGGGFTAAQWLNYFTAPLLLYLLMAIFSVALNRPLLSFLGGMLALSATLIAAGFLEFRPWLRAWEFVLAGRFGYSTAVKDGFAYPLGTQSFATVTYMDQSGVQTAETVHGLVPLPPGQWLVTLVLWTVLLTTGLWIAASRRRIG